MKHVQYIDQLKQILPANKYYALLELQDVPNIKPDVVKRIAQAIVDNTEHFKLFCLYYDTKLSTNIPYFNQ